MTTGPFMSAVVAIVALWAMTLPAWSDLVVTSAARYEGTIRRIDANGVEITLATGAVKIALADVRHVDMPKPSALDRGLDQIARNDFTGAIATQREYISLGWGDSSFLIKQRQVDVDEQGGGWAGILPIPMDRHICFWIDTDFAANSLRILL